MKSSKTNISREAWTNKWPLVFLLVFTLIAGIGYASFGLHPQLLQDYPQFTSFFAISFTFFAQVHILITAVVLAIYATHRVQLKWIGAFAAIYAISLASELTGTATGLPFGPYSYTDLLGAKWFDLVPILIPLSWFTMALPSYHLAQVTFPEQRQAWKRVAFGALLLALWDLALDPAMSFLTPYWQWGEEGTYYGMPWINLAGWYLTGFILMAVMNAMKADQWVKQFSLSWSVKYYFLVLLLPLLMVIAGGLWWCVLLTVVSIGLCALYILKKTTTPDGDKDEFGTPAPELLDKENLNDYFAFHSRSFSFAAKFFSPEQYRLVTRLYAFCRTTDDIADIYAASHGKEEAEKQLSDWEKIVFQSYEGIPSGIKWLDELMARSVQSGVPYEIISDLIAGVRSDLDKVELQSMEELDRYTYCVASVVGIWLCYLFGVREKEVLERAAALGRAMQITNIIRDVGEDLRMHRLYLPAELLQRFGVAKDELLAMEAGTLHPTEAYTILIEDLLERAEKDYNHAFRGLSAIPQSFAKAAAVASEIYRGIHKSVRRNKYNNFQRRAYTRWYEKIYLAFRALNKLKETQKRPFMPSNQSLYLTSKDIAKNGKTPRQLIFFLTPLFVLSTLLPFSHSNANTRPVLHRVEAPSHTHMKSSGEDLVDELRSKYIEGVNNEAAIFEALNVIKIQDELTPIVAAYFAALTVLKAKHAFWPIKKMKYLREGLPKLDSLVSQHPIHVEIRYLRLLSCYYLPRFLGRGDTVNEDSKALSHLLLAAHKDYPPELYSDMVQFVASSKALNQDERNKLYAVLKNTPGQSSELTGRVANSPD